MMSLGLRTLLVYCILAIDIGVEAKKCYACASPALKENWELTGLPAAPQNSSIFSVEDCNSIRNVPTVECSDTTGCFFGTFASISGEYMVVRGCVEEFLGDSGVTPNTGPVICEYAPSDRPVFIDNKPANVPLVGWYSCSTEENCNNMEVSFELATKATAWQVGQTTCKEPTSKTQCVSCQHFDGVGRCHHKSKTLCQGNYCTKLVGKLNKRWFEIRGCTSIIPLGLQTCIGYKKTLIIEQLGNTINQSYWSTNCLCQGERCNSSGSHLLSLAALLMCTMFLFKIAL